MTGTRMKARTRLLLATAATLVAASAITDAAQATAPPNNNYANATAFGTAPGQVIGSNVDATRETNEPDNGYKTVWWKWTAPDAGRYRLDTCDTLPAYNSTLGVYTGPNVSSLQPPPEGTIFTDSCDDDYGLDALVFDAVPGTLYRFSVGSRYSDDSSVNIRLSLRRTPANDNFASAYPFSGTSVSGTNDEASREFGEPDNGYRTIWWRWVAPSSGSFLLDTCDTLPGLSTTIGVYTGAAVSQLQEPSTESLGCPDYGSTVSFNAVQGTVYSLSVGSRYSSESSPNVVLNLVSQACLDARKAASKAKRKADKAQSKYAKVKAKVKQAKKGVKKAHTRRQKKSAKKKLKKAKQKKKLATKKLKSANEALEAALATRAASC